MFVTKFCSAAVDDNDGGVKPPVVDGLQGMSRSDTVVSEKIEFFFIFSVGWCYWSVVIF